MTAYIEAFLGIPLEKIWLSIAQTIYMVGIALLIGSVLAFAVAVLLFFTRKGGLYENAIIYNLINLVINIVRSTPFVVLLIAVMR